MHIDSKTHPRPRRVLSPHLQIYRLPLTALLSISHRISGALLAVGFILGNLLLVAAATNARTFELITGGLLHPMGRLAIAGWILLFNYHLVHGLRHLLWDLSLGFSRSKQTGFAVLELISAFTLTALMLLAPGLLESGSAP
jgi:succinate dehydrogenase / fumarate reductase cytochrome b subunit